MSEQREEILSAVRQAVQSVDQKTAYPEYDNAICVAEGRLAKHDLWSNFSDNFESVNGRAMTQLDQILTFLQNQKVSRGYCDPNLKDGLGQKLESSGLHVEYVFDPIRYDEYEFGVTRASGAIAETGTVVLTDSGTSDRLAALAPWIHIAVLESANLVRTLGDAIKQFGDDPNIIWATGPSKTADIEGVLIEGVHGPGEQICFCPEI